MKNKKFLAVVFFTQCHSKKIIIPATKRRPEINKIIKAILMTSEQLAFLCAAKYFGLHSWQILGISTFFTSLALWVAQNGFLHPTCALNMHLLIFTWQTCWDFSFTICLQLRMWQILPSSGYFSAPSVFSFDYSAGAIVASFISSMGVGVRAYSFARIASAWASRSITWGLRSFWSYCDAVLSIYSISATATGWSEMKSISCIFEWSMLSSSPLSISST